MRRGCTVALSSTIALFGAGGTTSQAQLTTFTITDGSVDFSLDGLTTGRTGTAGGTATLRTGVGGTPTNHGFQQWFWYRAAGDTREYALSNQIFGTASGNRVRLVYQEPSNNGATANVLRVEIEGTIANVGTAGEPKSLVVMAFKLSNVTASTQAIQFFSYTDLDLSGSAASDSAVVSGADNNVFNVQETAATRKASAKIVASATNHTAYQIGAFASIRGLLTDADVDNMANTGSPFAAGDFSGAHQWGVSLAAAGAQGDTLVGSVSILLQVEPDVCAQADQDGNGFVQPADIAVYVQKWLAALNAGCP